MADTKRSDALAEERSQLREQFDQMLRDAGIEDSQIERAWDGSFIPYGAIGDEDTSLSRQQNNKMYWADEHDAIRRKIRKLIFGVPDTDKRKALIAKCHEWEQTHVGVLEAMEAENQRELLEARSQSKLHGWTGAAISAALFVAIGYWLFKIPGAIAGAVAGFFLGQRQVAQQQIQAEARIRELEGSARDSKESLEGERRMPRFFNASERLGGEPDKEFGRESAVANLYQSFSHGKDS